MKRVLLIASHLGANSEVLCDCLNKNNLFHWVKEGLIYNHPSVVTSLHDSKHKYSNTIGLYVNEVIYNYQISNKQVYNFCEFIYLINSPKNSIKFINPGDAIHALNYYIFRLRRIYEMTKHTEGAIFLKWDDLVNKKGFNIISRKFDISEGFELEDIPNSSILPLPLLREAERAYELCLFRVKNNPKLLMC